MSLNVNTGPFSVSGHEKSVFQFRDGKLYQDGRLKGSRFDLVTEGATVKLYQTTFKKYNPARHTAIGTVLPVSRAVIKVSPEVSPRFSNPDRVHRPRNLVMPVVDVSVREAQYSEEVAVSAKADANPTFTIRTLAGSPLPGKFQVIDGKLFKDGKFDEQNQGSEFVLKRDPNFPNKGMLLRREGSTDILFGMVRIQESK